MATPLASLLDAFADDKSVDVIQAGTLRTTRGTALVLASILPIFYALDAVTDIKWLTDERKFLAAIAAGFIWAIVSAADSLARGLATKATDPAQAAAQAFSALPTPLKCVQTAGEDNPGWKAVAIRNAQQGSGPEFLLVKGTTTAWVKATDLKFG